MAAAFGASSTLNVFFLDKLMLPLSTGILIKYHLMTFFLPVIIIIIAIIVIIIIIIIIISIAIIIITRYDYVQIYLVIALVCIDVATEPKLFVNI